MSSVTKWRYTFPGFAPTMYDFENKEECVKQYVFYMLNRTQSMFEYSGLPDTIPARSLELYLQTVGHVGFFKHNGCLYVATGGLGGAPDVYYMPTLYTIANPALNYSANLEIGKDVIVMPNDALYIGLMPIMERYASALVENDLTCRIADINTRISVLISTADDKAKKSAEKYMSDIEKGKLGVIGESAFLEGLKAQPYTTSGMSRFTDLIEYQQYLKASWLNELGIEAPFNMKREALNSAESALNEEPLHPLIDDMLNQRKTKLDEVNQLFGTNIAVKLSGVWGIKKSELVKSEEGESIDEDEPDETQKRDA